MPSCWSIRRILATYPLIAEHPNTLDVLEITLSRISGTSRSNSCLALHINSTLPLGQFAIRSSIARKSITLRASADPGSRGYRNQQFAVRLRPVDPSLPCALCHPAGIGRGLPKYLAQIRLRRLARLQRQLWVRAGELLTDLSRSRIDAQRRPTQFAETLSCPLRYRILVPPFLLADHFEKRAVLLADVTRFFERTRMFRLKAA